MTSFNSRGSGLGQLRWPRGVVVLQDDNILVADGANHRIQKFSPKGKLIKTCGEEETNALQFDWPTGIGVHPLNNQLYITEENNHRVQVLDTNLNYVTMFGSKGSGKGQFQYPWDVSSKRQVNHNYQNNAIQWG